MDLQQHDVSYSAYLEVKFCPLVLKYLLVEWSFSIWTITSQPSCKVITTLQGYKHLTQNATVLWHLVPNKVVASRLPQHNNFHIGSDNQ